MLVCEYPSMAHFSSHKGGARTEEITVKQVVDPLHLLCIGLPRVATNNRERGCSTLCTLILKVFQFHHPRL